MKTPIAFVLTLLFSLPSLAFAGAPDVINGAECTVDIDYDIRGDDPHDTFLKEAVIREELEDLGYTVADALEDPAGAEFQLSLRLRHNVMDLTHMARGPILNKIDYWTVARLEYEAKLTRTGGQAIVARKDEDPHLRARRRLYRFVRNLPRCIRDDRFAATALTGEYVLVSGTHDWECTPALSLQVKGHGEGIAYEARFVDERGDVRLKLDSAPTERLKRSVVHGKVKGTDRPFLRLTDSDRTEYRDGYSGELLARRLETREFSLDSAHGDTLTFTDRYSYKALYSHSCTHDDFFARRKSDSSCTYRRR